MKQQMTAFTAADLHRLEQASCVGLTGEARSDSAQASIAVGDLRRLIQQARGELGSNQVSYSVPSPRSRLRLAKNA